MYLVSPNPREHPSSLQDQGEEGGVAKARGEPAERARRAAPSSLQVPSAAVLSASRGAVGEAGGPGTPTPALVALCHVSSCVASLWKQSSFSPECCRRGLQVKRRTFTCVFVLV